MNDKSNSENPNVDSPMSAAANDQQDDQYNHLHWLAFRYVADELTAEELAVFELRLADDLQAQEALVDVVSLSSSAYRSMAACDENSKLTPVLERTFQRTVDRPEKIKHTASLWRSVVALAAGVLVIGLAWQYLGSPGTWQSSAQQSATEKPSTDELSVGVWDQTVGVLLDDSAWQELAVKDGLYDDGTEYVESAEELGVDEGLVSLFSSAMSVSDVSKGEM